MTPSYKVLIFTHCIFLQKDQQLNIKPFVGLSPIGHSRLVASVQTIYSPTSYQTTSLVPAKDELFRGISYSTYNTSDLLYRIIYYIAHRQQKWFLHLTIFPMKVESFETLNNNLKCISQADQKITYRLAQVFSSVIKLDGGLNSFQIFNSIQRFVWFYRLFSIVLISDRIFSLSVRNYF